MSSLLPPLPTDGTATHTHTHTHTEEVRRRERDSEHYSTDYYVRIYYVTKVG